MTMPRQRHFRAEGGAATASFTLVELLVAVAILALLLIFAAQFVSLTSHTTVNDNRKIDALSQARLALDRFGLDWNAHIARDPGMAVMFTKNTGNDEISFATQMPAPGGSRAVAVVDYRINAAASAGNNAYRLERGILGFNWEGSGALPSPMTATNFPSLVATNFQTLSPGTFRLEFCLLSKAGASGKPAYWWVTDHNSSVTTITNVAAIIVAVAAVGDSARKLVSTDQMQTLAGALGDVQDKDPVATWQAALDQPSFAATAKVPPAVAQAVRVYERYFYVDVVP